MYIQESDVQFSPFISKYTELFDDACYPKKDNAIHEERLSKIRDLMWLAERIFGFLTQTLQKLLWQLHLTGTVRRCQLLLRQKMIL